MLNLVWIYFSIRLTIIISYPTFKTTAKKVLAMFGSFYSCEQLFSQMNFVKNKLGTKLTQEHYNLPAACFFEQLGYSLSFATDAELISCILDSLLIKYATN